MAIGYTFMTLMKERRVGPLTGGTEKGRQRVVARRLRRVTDEEVP